MLLWNLRNKILKNAQKLVSMDILNPEILRIGRKYEGDIEKLLCYNRHDC